MSSSNIHEIEECEGEENDVGQRDIIAQDALPYPGFFANIWGLGLSVYDPLSAVTSGMDLTAHYCPQETFAILSCNKRNGSEREHLDHRVCKRSYLISRACVWWDTRIYIAPYIFVLENHPGIFKSQNHWDILSVTESFVDLQDSSAISESRRRSHLSGFHQLSSTRFTCASRIRVLTTKEWVQNHNQFDFYIFDRRENRIDSSPLSFLSWDVFS